MPIDGRSRMDADQAAKIWRDGQGEQMNMNNDWVSVLDSPPTQADADDGNCVIYWHDLLGVTVSGWHQYKNNSFLRWWMRCPEAPGRKEKEGTAEYRRIEKSWRQRGATDADHQLHHGE